MLANLEKGEERMMKIQDQLTLTKAAIRAAALEEIAREREPDVAEGNVVERLIKKWIGPVIVAPIKEVSYLSIVLYFIYGCLSLVCHTGVGMSEALFDPEADSQAMYHATIPFSYAFGSDTAIQASSSAPYVPEKQAERLGIRFDLYGRTGHCTAWYFLERKNGVTHTKAEAKREECTTKANVDDDKEFANRIKLEEAKQYKENVARCPQFCERAKEGNCK